MMGLSLRMMLPIERNKVDVVQLNGQHRAAIMQVEDHTACRSRTIQPAGRGSYRTIEIAAGYEMQLQQLIVQNKMLMGW